MSPAQLLEVLPPFQFHRDIKVKKQTTDNIIIQVLNSHRQHEKDYDLIASQFEGRNIPKKLFDFCRQWLRYTEEEGADQTTRSPAGILTLADHAGVDCKHYANFIAGVIDALNRQGHNINWCYRFVSYKSKKASDHVYVVLLDDDTWLDPAPLKDQNGTYYTRTFNDRDAIPAFYMDIKMDDMLSHLSGVHYFISDDSQYQNKNGCVGNAAIGGDEEDSDDAFFVELLNKAVEEVKKFFDKVFGGGWQFSTGVRWLTAYYQLYVLGQANVTSSNKVDERYSPDAQGWFALVLGVPIYDRYRLHALMGTNPADGAPLNKTDQQKVQEYLAFGPDTSSVDPVAVMQAVQIAKQFKWGTAPGSWAKFSKAAPDVSTPLPPPPPPPPKPIDPDSQEPTLPTKPLPQEAGMNTLAMVLLGGAVVGLLLRSPKPKQKRRR